MDKPNITTLFLDIGNVLLTNGWDHHMRRLAAEKFNLDYDEINDRHHLTFDTYEEGKLSLDDYLTRVIFYEDRTFSREDFRAFMFAQSQPIPEMIDWAKELKARHNLKIATISNEGKELTIYRIRKFNLGAFVDFFISSCFVHQRKPDLDLYRLALDCAQVPPRNIVYIDDRAMFTEVACSLGIHCIHHTGFETTKAALAGLGLSAD